MTCSQIYYDGETEFPALLKGCANEQMCGNEGRVSAEKIKYRFYTTCCKGDFCNRDEHRFPLKDLTPNGVKCPSCYSCNSTEECVSTKEMNCTGSEALCFTYLGAMEMPDNTVMHYSMKGCSNNFTCQHHEENEIGVTFLYGKGMSCYTPHNPPVPPKYTNGS
ncbi:phospholipase A2 inhibitor and Ly6/PLAUR domain-containing protein-like [Engystomops pustulosus]|uniref:phospholipase A2 inhibitor and Ly6/PLAUR domain-containing protein-like n=1 Tax=Engystomops pustulosus TaxID=76066 RepID=UPI003AFA1955